MEKLSPIIIFAFNRPKALSATISSLLYNEQAKNSDLFIFVDGPRNNKVGEKEKVEAVRKIASTIKGFRSTECVFSNSNKGLGQSIINGVTDIITKYGRVIVIEDDLIVQPNFLAFMNAALDRYENDKNVWSICGYTNKVSLPKKYDKDAYFCTRSSSWGWGTWVDRWQSVDWSFSNWEEWSKHKKAFNRWGGSDCFSMLNACREGRNKSWAIRFCFNQFLQDKVSLFPIKSLVNNNGFDGEGTNCKKYSRFKFELMSPNVFEFNLPYKIEVDRDILKQVKYYNSIPLRAWSRIMYMLNR